MPSRPPAVFSAAIAPATLALSLALSLAACAPTRTQPFAPIAATAGRDFPRQAFATFRLHQTTAQQAEALLGPPLNRVALKTTANNPRGPVPLGTPIDMALLRYAYVVGNAAPRPGPHIAIKVATLVFFSGTLAAYDVNSTIPGDANPPIEDEKLPLLKEGTSTRNDIIGLMGPPTGQSEPLPYAAKSQGHITYAWARFEGPALRRKILIIDLNRNDVMTHYTLLDGSGPIPPATPTVPPPQLAPLPSTPPDEDFRQGPTIRS